MLSHVAGLTVASGCVAQHAFVKAIVLLYQVHSYLENSHEWLGT